MNNQIEDRSAQAPVQNESEPKDPELRQKNKRRKHESTAEQDDLTDASQWNVTRSSFVENNRTVSMSVETHEPASPVTPLSLDPEESEEGELSFNEREMNNNDKEDSDAVREVLPLVQKGQER